MDKPKLKKIKLRIHGMHCESCEVLIERKFKNVHGIVKVNVNHAKGCAEINCTEEPDIRRLNELVNEDGYNVSSWQDRNITVQTMHKNTGADYLQMELMFIAIFAVYYFLQKFDFLPDISVSGSMSYGFIFVIGLFAAVSSCIAVVGGLLLAVAGKYNELHPGLEGIKKFKPHIYFNLGRVAGYTVLGALVGAVGSALSLSPGANGYLMLFMSVVMLILGFQLLHIFPGLRKFVPKTPKFISHKIHDLSASDSKGAPFVLGSLTFFLPCGFTQALQLYVLASGDWRTGALTMLVFSLGTLPALVSLGAVTSFSKGAAQKHILRFAGVLIVLLSLFNINNGLTLAGYNIDFKRPASSEVIIVNGKQIVNMKVEGYNYIPNRFTVTEGVPVEWQIDGDNAAGCGRVIVVPSLGISKFLSTGITTITFTPGKTGEISFNCSMGMMTRGSGFTVISRN